MKKISILPRDDKTNGWSGILALRQSKPALRQNISADWIVLGAGYAGLAAARRIAETRPNDSVAVVEAQQLGESASGRNAGFAIDLPHNTGSSMEELAKGRSYMKLARAGIAALEEQVRTKNIACEWSYDGKYHAAVTARGANDILKPTAQELERLGEPYQWIEADELSHRLGTRHFQAAIFTPGTVLLNPAAINRGLGDTLPENVTLYENSPVTDADFGTQIVLKTAQGSVSAPKAILAVNAFAEQFGFWKQRLLPFAVHASLSRQLTEAERAAIGNVKPWGLTPANAFAGVTMRYTNDHRILIRQNVHFCPGMRQSDERRRQIAVEHQKLFDKRFPDLHGVTMEFTWTGFVCLSRNGAPGFGQVKPNVWSAVCQNAVGITKGTISGLLAADLATGEDNPLITDMYSLGTPDKVPPRPFLDIGVRGRFALELWRNRHEA